MLSDSVFVSMSVIFLGIRTLSFPAGAQSSSRTVASGTAITAICFDGRRREKIFGKLKSSVTAWLMLARKPR